MLELPPSEEPEYLQFMFSVPYSFTWYSAHLSVGIAPFFHANTSSAELFNSFYHYSEATFSRNKAGTMVEFEGSRGGCFVY